jgi:YbgC/YbaW family acyl-CoA thioester hydrolase
MPLTYERTFRVRHYECDTTGCVKCPNYLNYMQEAAFDASAAAGYSMDRYATMDRYWLVRETDIEYLRPLRYGDSVQVRTWVADFRRVRSRRSYELRKAESGELVARASTDWVFLDTAADRPVSIPREMMEAFFPEGAPDRAPPRARFPSASPPDTGIFRLHRRVEWQDVDPAHHVNNAVYLAYLEECRLQAQEAIGWPQARMQEVGLAIRVRRYQIEYRQPGLLGDELELATWVSDLKDTTAMRHSTVTRVGDGELLAQARMYWETTDLETGRPVCIPATLALELGYGTLHEGR